MMNKAIKTLVLAMVDSFKKFKGKTIVKLVAIFAMIFGSTTATQAVTFNLGDGASPTVAEITNGTIVESVALSVAGAVIVVDGDGIIDTATNLSFATITSTTNETTNVVIIEAGGKTVTVTGAVISTEADTATYNLTQSGATIDLQGAVSGGAEDAIDFVAAANTTIKLSGDVAYSANFLGAGTLHVTGEMTTDETIGAGTVMGALNLDGQITSTDTIAVTNLDLDGTLAGATSFDAAGTAALNGNMTATGVITIDGATTLDGDSSLTTTNAKITLTGAINGTGIDLTMGAGSAEVELGGIIGGSAGVGAIAITGSLDLNAAITDAESLSVTLGSDIGSNVTTTGTTGTTITLTDVVNFSGATVLTTANTNISLEEVTGATTLAFAAGTGTVTTSAAMTQVTTMTITSAATSTFAAVTNATSTVINNSGANTFSGILTSPIIDINSGTTTLSGVATATNRIDVAGASTILNIDAAPDTAKLTMALGTVNIGIKDIDVDDLDLNSGSIVIEKTLVSGDTVFIAATQTGAGLAGTGKIYLPVNLSNDQTLVLFKDNEGSTVGATTEAQVEAVISDTVLTDYVVSEVGNNVVLTSSDKTSSATATALGITSNAAKALLQARNSVISDTTVDGTAEDIFFNVLNAKGGLTSADAKALAKQIAPANDTIGGSAVATRAMTGTVQGIVSNRMASLRSGDAFVTGMSAGNGMSANSGFIQAFGSEAEQKNTSSSGATVFGFDAETSGVAIGFDGMTEEGSTVGLSASYSSSDIDGKGTSKSKNSVDSYTVSLYADKATENGYIEGSVTYGINENSTSRLVNAAGFDRKYSADYDSNQISVKVGGGVPNEVRDGTFVTPYMSATATTINTDAYTEKSTVAADNLRLKVAQNDIQSLVGTVGVKAHMITDKGTPMISLSVNNEFGDNTISSQNTYTGGGTAFKTSTDVEELSATLGLGYSFGNDAASLNLNYEANANDDDYLSHYGTVKIIAKF